ncbi:MAG: 30S ribosome-binding factor RbfA [Anaerococcus sp.]
MDKRRAARIAAEMQKEISKIVMDDLNDPRLTEDVLVSITDVEVTSDLSYADIYVSVLGDKSKQESVFDALKQATGYIKLLIGERMRLRSMPEFRFKEDISIKRGAYMDKLIKETIEKDKKDHDDE